MTKQNEPPRSQEALEQQARRNRQADTRQIDQRHERWDDWADAGFPQVSKTEFARLLTTRPADRPVLDRVHCLKCGKRTTEGDRIISDHTGAVYCADSPECRDTWLERRSLGEPEAVSLALNQRNIKSLIQHVIQQPMAAEGGRPRMAKKELTPCECGCGTQVKGRFAPGHDAKLKSALIAKALGGDAKAEQGLRDRNWYGFLERKREIVAAKEQKAQERQAEKDAKARERAAAKKESKTSSTTRAASKGNGSTKANAAKPDPKPASGRKSSTRGRKS